MKIDKKDEKEEVVKKTNNKKPLLTEEQIENLTQYVMWFLAICFFPISLIISIVIAHKVEKARNPIFVDAFKQEEVEFQKYKIELAKIANPKKAEIFDVQTNFGKTEVIRWNNTGKKVVLFVHGIWCDKYTSAKAVWLWKQLGYDVISFDGYGWGSTRQYNTKTQFGGAKQVVLIDTVITEIKKRYKINKLIIHGESMGGGSVYKYIEIFGTNNFSHILIDSGYTNFYENFQYLAIDKIGKPLLHFIQPTLWIPFMIKEIPVFEQIKSEKIENCDVPLLHLHSEADNMVSFQQHLEWKKHYKNKATSYIYENKKVRHVRGYYDSPDELIKVVKKLIK